MINQLALNIPINEQKTMGNFIWGENVLLQQTITDALAGQDKCIYFFGKPSSGKSHLLQGICQALDTQTSVYLPLTMLKLWGVESISGMHQHTIVTIDDIDCIAGDKAWEEGIFHLFNQIRDKQSLLFITAQTIPAHLDIKLPDLSSRLNAALILPLHPLNDEGKIQVLQTQAKRRGFELSQSVSQFLLNRCGRNLSHLSTLLDKLDNASLAAQRKITIPFAKTILGL